MLFKTIFIVLLFVAWSKVEACRAVRGNMMTCLDATEKDLPKTIDNKIHWLTFKRCSIPRIKSSFMKLLPELTDFHAEDNGIEVIEKDAFKGLKSLNWIDLSSNKIKEIDINLLSDAKAVDHFNISQNFDLNFPQKSPFLKSNSLKWLDISACNIREISTESFSELPALTDISMSSNLLTSIPAKAFHKNPLLRTFDITSNKITTLSPDVFAVDRVMIIRLEDNPWNCDCKLTPLLIWSRRNVLKGNVQCVKPTNMKWKDIAKPQPCK